MWERVTAWVGENESLGGYLTGREWCMQEAKRIVAKGGGARVNKRRTYQMEYCVERPANEVTIMAEVNDDC